MCQPLLAASRITRRCTGTAANDTQRRSGISRPAVAAAYSPSWRHPGRRSALPWSPATAVSFITSSAARSAKKNTFSDTLLLPATPFELRANAVHREPLFRQRTTSDLYRWQAQQEEWPLYVLHDGPPYANGELHMGHALNKILKDINIRFQVLQGKRVHYHPGWDCHGLPIEAKAIQLPRFHGIPQRKIPPMDLRDEARRYATTQIKAQRESFQEYAIMADWGEASTYKTYTKDFVLRQLAIFREMVNRGLIYRATRPVYWSPSSRTALAESELEYRDGVSQRSVWCRFDLHIGPTLQERIRKSGAQGVVDGAKGITLPVWTTTPWTLPSNMAVNINAHLMYGLYRLKEGPLAGEIVVLAVERAAAFSKLRAGLVHEGGPDRPKIGMLDELATFKGSELLDSSYYAAFQMPNEASRPIIPADYVSSDSGTGLVHSAPGHGHEDYDVWKEYCKQHTQHAKKHIVSPIDDEAQYTTQVIDLLGSSRGSAVVGQKVQGMKAIFDFLQEDGRLISEQPINNHRTPCDWRTKLPVITRCTPQWFANLEPIKDAALSALQKVRFVPESGRARLENLVRTRNEWCISRQRAWGVPIPVLYNAATGEALLTDANIRHIEAVLAEKGIDYWWQGAPDEFVAQSEQHKGQEWIKGTDTVDVWFDSGSSWATLPGAQEAQSDPANFSAPKEPVADLYIEGIDQHRGWFQSSLLTFVATSRAYDAASAPYRTVATHGFTVDTKSQKMSKSLGNVIAPSFFLKGGPKKNDVAYGADVLRMWAARADYTSNVIVSPLVVKHAAEALFPIRNRCRFLLSNMPRDPEKTPALVEQELTLLERFVLDDLCRLEKACKEAYEELDYRTVLRLVGQFANGTISSVFAEMSKEILYCDLVGNPQRQAVVAVMGQVLRTIMMIMAPIAPHLAEELYHFSKGAKSDPPPSSPDAHLDSGSESVFRLGWQSIPERYIDEEARIEFSQLMHLRTAILSLMEGSRNESLFQVTSELNLDISLGVMEGASSVVDDGKAKAQETEPILEGHEVEAKHQNEQQSVKNEERRSVVSEDPFPPSDPLFRKRPVADLLLKHKDLLLRFLNVGRVRLFDRAGEMVYNSGHQDHARSTPVASADTEDGAPVWERSGHHLDCTFKINPSRAHKCPRCRTHRRRPQRALCSRCEDVVRKTHPDILARAQKPL